jgi:eukaryotic-like serine/threonine-protein kinase
MNQFETMDGTVFGTPRYMSPEQAQGKPLDARSDLYAVGIVLYELLVGAPPFVDKDAVIVMAKHIREEPPTLRRAAPGRSLPASLQRVLDRALAKAPEARFQTAEEFERALDRSLRYADLLDRLPARGQQLMNAAMMAPRMARFGTAAALFALLAVVGTRLAVGHGAAAATPSLSASEPPVVAPRIEAPPAAEAPKAPAPLETHVVTVYSDPAGANVWHHGRFVGVTPLPVEVEHGRSLRVRVAMPGYAAQTLDLNPTEGVRSIKLEQLHPVAQKPAAAVEPAQLTQRERAHPQRKAKHAAANEKPSGEPAQQQAREAYEKF